MPLTDRRTQLYLTEEQYQAVRRLARDRGASLAAVVREAVDDYVAAAKSAAPWERDAARDLVGCLELPPLAGNQQGHRELDEAIDRSVYDETEGS